MFHITLKKGIISLTIIAAIFGTILFFLENNKKKNQVCFGDNCFEVELAVTPEQQTRGLMFRENLDPEKGMLFVFKKEGDYPFWMKNTKIPLDIIWIDKDKKVVFISQNTPPCLSDPCDSIDPNEMTKYVLEINGNTVQKLGISIGDQADIKITLSKSLIF